MTKAYLLEIGVEELPAKYIKNTLKQLKEKFDFVLKNERLNYEEIKVYATPRRLTTIITGLAEGQEDLVEEVKGPSKRISFDDEGIPTKALLGFMRGQNIQLEDISFKEFKGEEYVYARVLKKGQSTAEILSRKVQEIIRSLNFPKSMKWGGKNLRFARPIRWIVSILDDRVVDFQLEAIPVSNISKGIDSLAVRGLRLKM